MRARLLILVGLVALWGAGSAAQSSPPSSTTPSDLDEFMSRVLARRDENWKKLQQYILNEREKGPFKDWNDFVTRVKGVGTDSAAKFSADGMTVNGASYKAVAKADVKADAKADKAAAKPVTEKAKDAAVATKDAVKGAAVATKDAVKETAKDVKAAVTSQIGL